MLIWLCALKCEAKPLIDFYRLQKEHTGHRYTTYRGNGMTCIVSGIGSLNMAGAAEWAGRSSGTQSGPQLWINLGIAGHASLELGSLAIAASYRAANGSAAIAARLPFPTDLPLVPLISLPQPQSHYPPDAMIDMEGWGFASTLKQNHNMQWVQSLKVISDNEKHPPTRDKAIISGLIAAKMQAIDEFACALIHQAHLTHE